MDILGFWNFNPGCFKFHNFLKATFINQKMYIKTAQESLCV